MPYRLPPIQLGKPGEEIGFRDLRSIADRFKKQHALKKEHIRKILNSGQRQFLDVLPLVLHINHPALPGFISASTPAGIYDYQPDRCAMDAARQINRSFSLQPHHIRQTKAAVDGLFLMGSVGSIAFTKASDIDIWVCHNADLGHAALDELKRKIQVLEHWAAAQNLEVHFFLINSAQFLHDPKYPISADSSGETQHYLLLEEFYRTSVYIAGKMLAWWLVPPELECEYDSYLAHLLARRYIKAEQILDLGGLQRVPAEEFISATLWHIYKALLSPYKSLLKLALLECYASEYPHINWLCTDIKRAVYQGCLDGLEWDSYVQIYRRLEDYLLKSSNTERLTIIRQIFCRRLTEAAGDHRQLGSESPYEDYFREIAETWRWPHRHELSPCTHAIWDIEKILAENAAIIGQLTQCHDRINCFASEHIAPDFQESSDMKLLGNKLRAFFLRRPGKVEITTTLNSNRPIKPSLSIVEKRDTLHPYAWQLFFGKKNHHNSLQAAPLYSRQTLIEMLCWLTVNGFHRPDVPIHCVTESLTFLHGELHAALYGLRDFFKRHFDFSDALGKYQGVNAIAHTLLIVNFGRTSPEQAAGPLTLSARANPLSYGAERECLVQSIDSVSISRWNEVFARHGEGCNGLFNVLIEIVNGTAADSPAERIDIVCRTPGFAHGIIHRVEQLFAHLLDCRRSIADRYVLAAGKHVTLFDKDGDAVRRQNVEHEDALLEILASPRRLFGTVIFDDGVLAATPVPFLYQQNRAQAVQCYFERRTNDIAAYVVDEKGALYYRRHADCSLPTLAVRYVQILTAILPSGLVDADSMQFYELANSPNGEWDCRPLTVTPQPSLPLPQNMPFDQTVSFLKAWPAD